jgi:protocatechuate 3,4-dioxygenase beta subunit
VRFRLTIAAIGVLAIAGLIVWRCRGGDAPVDRAASDPRSAIASRPRSNPATLKRGSIAGTVTDDAKRPVAGARVCARGWSRELGTEPFREPTCGTADSRGAYNIDGLLPARYAVTASARPYRPALYTRDAGILLAEGARVTGISIVLHGGGVELTGVVADVTAGPIARARVTATTTSSLVESAAVTVEADDQGRFVLWVAPGAQHLTATANGYADAHASADAPGNAEIRMTPEAALEGTVVDAATGAPIEGARVGITTYDWRDDADQVVASDAHGVFRFDRLLFDRFTIVARTEHRYGRSAGSLLVGLGQHLDGVVIRMYPARQVAGKVVITPGGAPCAEPYGSLRDDANDRWITLVRAGDELVADGVLPGTYTPNISCTGFVDRATYDPITVGDGDVSGLRWEVTVGATLRGKVSTRGGAPIGGAWVYNERAGHLTDKAARSRDDGSYELAGLAVGGHQVKIRTERAVVDRDDAFVLSIDAPGIFEHDFVLDEAGSIEGTTVDADRQRVAYEDVVVAAVDPDRNTSTNTRSNEAGVFTVRGLRPGDYRVETSERYYADSHRDDAQGPASRKPTISVRANQVTTVKVVTAPKRNAIAGEVVDALGKPVADALVVAVSESRLGGDARSATRWMVGERPVLTSTDGTFALTKLAAGSFVVRAYRKGGGEAIAEHVPVGSSIKLQIGETGAISGSVTDRSGAIQELVVNVADDTAGLTRTERFFGTAGRYTIGDLPKGRYTVQWNAEHGWKRTEVTLEEGESKSVDVELEPLVAVTGRVVDLRAHTPLAAIKVTAYATENSGSYAGTATSDVTGRFRMSRVPPGPLELRLAGMEPYPGATALRSVDRTTGTVDLGDLPMVKARVTGDDPVGALGFDLDDSRDTTIRRERKVRDIDPDGPATHSGLREGDVIVRVDGVDLNGPGYDHWDAAVTAPPGTTLVFDLARGAKVSIVLARPTN